MLSALKKRHVVSFEKLSQDILDLLKEKFPQGFDDYLVKYTPAGHEPFYAVTLETETDVYLIKVKVDVDDVEDIERWLQVEEDAENDEVAGSSEAPVEGDTLPDDNISQYGSDDESSEA